MKIIFDTESTCLEGPLITIQWSTEDNFQNIILHEVWQNPLQKTISIIELFCENELILFNAVHDWFQLSKWYNVFRQLTQEELNIHLGECDGYTLRKIIRRVQGIEARGPQPTDVCLRPKRACDLMLFAKSGKYQYLAKHKPIIIRKIPRTAARSVIEALDNFTKSNIKGLPKGIKIRWRTQEKRSGRQDVIDIVGEFENLSGSLKNIISIIKNDPSIAEATFEQECGRIPYRDQPDWMPWGGQWEEGLLYLRDRFSNNEQARSYAIRDVEYTYLLWTDLGFPVGGDDDSELACLIGAARWRGFSVAPQSVLLEKIKYYKEIQSRAPTSPNEVMQYLSGYLDDVEKTVLMDTKKTTLEELARWEGHKVQEPVKMVQAARRAQRRIDTLRKLHKAGRFCFSMKVSGTLSSRMAGGSEGAKAGGGKRLNAQGIPREKEFRELFSLAFEEEHLEGGDYDGLEVSIACSVDKDPQLIADLEEARASGVGFHAITGSIIYNTTPSEIKKTKATVDDKYVRSKNCFFGWRYGSHLHKFAKTANLEEREAENSYIRLKNRYKVITERMKETWERFTPLRQSNGPGTAIEWVEPCPYIDSLLGARRHFDLEWGIIKILYSLANDPPNEWENLKGECRRTNRIQSIKGAIQSALYAAIFALQAHVFRAAANHEIQAPGAQLTKKLQRNIWDLQPVGIGPWVVRPLGIHDEIECPTTLQGILKDTVIKTVKIMQKQIPLLKMDWKEYMKDWGEK